MHSLFIAGYRGLHSQCRLFFNFTQANSALQPPLEGEKQILQFYSRSFESGPPDL